MSLVNLDRDSLERSLTATADVIRDKLNDGKRPCLFDMDGRTGFARDLQEVPQRPPVGFEGTDWDRFGYPVAGILWNMPDIPPGFCSGEYFSRLESIVCSPAAFDGSIGAGAFAGCAALMEFDFTGFTAIGSKAFEGCSRLSEINLSKAIDSIAVDAFSNSGITTIYCDWYEGGKPSVEADAPWGATNANVTYKEQQLWIAFSSPESFTVKQKNSSKYWNGTIQYSTDKVNWSAWNGSTTLESAYDNNIDSYILYMRGIGNTGITTGYTGAQAYRKAFAITGSNVSVYGNLECLLDYQTVCNGGHPTMAANCFASLFQSNAALTSFDAFTDAPLSYYCYSMMFAFCTALKNAPALPSVQLAEGCYYQMFSECTSLETIPELPATDLPSSCYRYMFSSCVSLEFGERFEHVFRIPAEGEAVNVGANALASMFLNVPSFGEANGTPQVNTSYLVKNPLVRKAEE